jgi:hypothetical protein
MQIIFVITTFEDLNVFCLDYYFIIIIKNIIQYDKKTPMKCVKKLHKVLFPIIHKKVKASTSTTQKKMTFRILFIVSCKFVHDICMSKVLPKKFFFSIGLPKK